MLSYTVNGGGVVTSTITIGDDVLILEQSMTDYHRFLVE